MTDEPTAHADTGAPMDEAAGGNGAAGGDDACWLDRVCDDCGGFIENGGEHTCRVAVPPGDAG